MKAIFLLPFVLLSFAPSAFANAEITSISSGVNSGECVGLQATVTDYIKIKENIRAAEARRDDLSLPAADRASYASIVDLLIHSRNATSERLARSSNFEMIVINLVLNDHAQEVSASSLEYGNLGRMEIFPNTRNGDTLSIPADKGIQMKVYGVLFCQKLQENGNNPRQAAAAIVSELFPAN